MAEAVIRFAVRDRGGLRAGTWRCFTNGGKDASFYVLCRTIGDDFKLSFHESGDCNYSITQVTYDARMAPTARPQSRYLEHWRRPAPLEADFVHACSVIVPGNSMTVPDSGERNIAWVDDPGSGKGVEFAVFVTRGADAVVWLAGRGTTARLIGRFELSNGESVTVASLERPLTLSGHQISGTPRFFTGGGEEALAKAQDLRAILHAVDSKDARILFDLPLDAGQATRREPHEL